MAKPNYSFEKRQRELAKKKKKEEKEREKAERKAGLGIRTTRARQGDGVRHRGAEPPRLTTRRLSR